MATGYVLTNRKAGNGTCGKDISLLELLYDAPLQYQDVADVTDYRAFLEAIGPEDFLILAGGDGTLNHFINNTAGLSLP